MRLRVLLGLLVLLMIPRIVQAQSDTLDESAFWDQLRQTQMLLTNVLSQPDPGAAAAHISQWNAVKHVRVQGAVIDVDMRWLTDALASHDTASLRQAQQQIGALLDFHDHGGTVGDGLSLGKLADILKDPRFQYPDTTPTVIPTPTQTPDDTPATASPGGLSAGLSQLLLTVVGVIFAAGVLIYIARNLNIQRVELPASPTDDPTTSGTAVEMASDRAANRDYRTAIRYLYLSSLLTLDERGLIHYDATLTNREHLRQIDDQPQLLSLLRPIVSAFEDVWYGYAPVDDAFYQRFSQDIQKLQQFVR